MPGLGPGAALAVSLCPGLFSFAPLGRKDVAWAGFVRLIGQLYPVEKELRRLDDSSLVSPSTPVAVWAVALEREMKNSLLVAVFMLHFSGVGFWAIFAA